MNDGCRAKPYSLYARSPTHSNLPTQGAVSGDCSLSGKVRVSSHPSMEAVKPTISKAGVSEGFSPDSVPQTRRGDWESLHLLQQPICPN
jgi:hypothetical protein